MKILYYEVGKLAKLLELKSEQGSTEELYEMQKLVGGYIEKIVLSNNDRVLLICNEEAKIKGLPLNRKVNDITNRSFDKIAGNFFICCYGGEEFQDIKSESMSVIDRCVQKMIGDERV